MSPEDRDAAAAAQHAKPEADKPGGPDTAPSNRPVPRRSVRRRCRRPAGEDFVGGLSDRMRALVERERHLLAQLSRVDQQAFWRDIDERAHSEQAAARAQMRRERYLRQCPPDHADARYDGLLAQQNPNGKASSWLASGHANALIMGPSGHGKSHLAYTIGNHAVDAGLWVEAWYVPDLVPILVPPDGHERTDHAHRLQRAHTLAAMRRCDLLIWDDLGTETTTGYHAREWIGLLTTILKHRTDVPDRRTIVVAGADERRQATHALRRYGPQFLTRLRQDCVGMWVAGQCLRQAANWNPF